MITPTCDYWPMAPKADGTLRWAEYRSYQIEGYWHADTMQLDIGPITKNADGTWKISNGKLYLPGHDIRRTYVPLTRDQKPRVAIVYTAAGVAVPDNWEGKCDTLVQGVYTADGKQGFVGEMGTLGASWTNMNTADAWTPEPECPLDPGDYLTPTDGVCNWQAFDPATGVYTEGVIPWRFKNFGVGNCWWFDTYPNQLRTALMERPDTFDGENVYNYLFSSGHGLLNCWWGQRNKDNTVTQNAWAWEIIQHN